MAHSVVSAAKDTLTALHKLDVDHGSIHEGNLLLEYTPGPGGKCTVWLIDFQRAVVNRATLADRSRSGAGDQGSASKSGNIADIMGILSCAAVDEEEFKSACSRDLRGLCGMADEAFHSSLGWGVCNQLREYIMDPHPDWF
jgi:hypothetical protein